MASEKLAQLEWEFKMKDLIITQAKAAYVGEYERGDNFDVVFEKQVWGDRVAYIGHVIIYYGRNNYISWKRIMTCQRRGTIGECMETLLDLLRTQLAKVLPKQGTLYANIDTDLYHPKNDPFIDYQRIQNVQWPRDRR